MRLLSAPDSHAETLSTHTSAGGGTRVGGGSQGKPRKTSRAVRTKLVSSTRLPGASSRLHRSSAPATL